MACPTRVMLAVAILASGAGPARGQTRGPTLILGVGRTSWDGPYITSGPLPAVSVLSPGARNHLALLGLGGEIAGAGRIRFRAEAGFGHQAADLGNSGSLELPTRLSWSQIQVTGLGRWYPGRNRAVYFEAGATSCIRAACDVDLIGGPGFLGGETIGCNEWDPGAGTSGRPIRPADGGVDGTLGAGGYHGRFGVGIRYQFAGTARMHANGLPIMAHTLALTVEWILRSTPR
jgi:hypothetical protein